MCFPSDLKFGVTRRARFYLGLMFCAACLRVAAGEAPANSLVVPPKIYEVRELGAQGDGPDD